MRLARQAGQITAGIPGGLARRCSYVLASVLADAGNLAEAARVGAAGLARARAAGDLWNQASLLPRIVELDLRAGRTGDAAAHLREGLHLAARTGSWFDLLTGISQCGDLCAATGRVLAAIQGGRQRAGCVFAGERGFRGGSGCGGVACDDTVSVSVMGRPSPLSFCRSPRGGP